MKLNFSQNGTEYLIDTDAPLDISMPLRHGTEWVNCFYAPPVEFTPVRMGDFVGSTQEGGVVNFKNVRLNPHGNGTHTECVGHIAKEVFTINECLEKFHYTAELITVWPTVQDNGDRVIMKEMFVDCFPKVAGTEAIIIRTMPNDSLKMTTKYSGANPPYLHHEATEYLVQQGVRHLLIDLPSVDREEDAGLLLSHHTFWKYPNTVAEKRTDCTITELVYVPDNIKDGHYLLHLGIASFEMDASPSKPVLYKLHTV